MIELSKTKSSEIMVARRRGGEKETMKKILCFAFMSFVLTLFIWSKESDNNHNEKEVLISILKNTSEKYKIPGLAAAIVTSNGLEQIASYGVRKYNTDIRITDNDIWHLGSNTKMITASLLAIYVDKGIIKWNTTIQDVFHDTIEIDQKYRNVTILALLSHRGGLPENIDYSKISCKQPLKKQRLEIAKLALSKKPKKNPGSGFFYSNTGYIIAGSMLETVTNKDWETLIEENIFVPLGMSSAGFGGIGTVGQIDQPWGHADPKTPFTINGPEADNPPVIGPAGSIHCTITDWSKFIIDQLRGSQGTPGLLQEGNYHFIQSSHYNDDYGLGWICTKRDWADGIALSHAGSNTLFMSLVWLVPSKDLAILVCTNEGKVSEQAADDIVVEILKQRKILF
jgi:CubicO group peptidase (beta-lactamase class C family)